MHNVVGLANVYMDDIMLQTLNPDVRISMVLTLHSLHPHQL